MEPEESSQDAVSQPFVEESSKGEDKAVSQPFTEESSKEKVKAVDRSTGGSFERLKLAGLAGTMGSVPSRMWMGVDEWVLDTREEYHWSSGPQLLLDRVKLSSGLEKGSVRTERLKIPGVRCRQGRERKNVVSVQQLARDHGLVTVFEPTGCYVKDKAETIVGQGRSGNGKYVLNYLDITKAQEKGIRDVKTSPDQGSLAGSQPEREWPDDGCWFGQTRLDRHSGLDRHFAKDPTVDVFLAMAQSRRIFEFMMDSGACHHVTWKGDVLKAYHDDLQISPPMQSLTMREGHVIFPRAHSVDGIGYIDSAGGSLDRVLFVPSSPYNVVSVSQLTEDCSVRVVFNKKGFWIEKLETKDRIGGGIHSYLGCYMLVRLNVGAESDWVLDSFAWFHHTSDRRLLHNLQEKAEDLPPPAVGDQLQSLEHGSVGTERFKVPKVRYIAGHATRNVVSVAQLAYDHGLVTVFEPTGCHVKDKQTWQIVGKGRLRDGTYVLDYLRIGQAQAQVQDVVDASLPPDLQGSQELQGRGPRPQLEWLGEADRFGQPRFDRAKDPTVAVFPTLPHNQPRTMDFYMASGERHHMTWNGAILMAYHADMHINPPIQYVTGVLPGSPLTVGGIGYIDSKAGSLDRVLFVPSSPVNIVSVSQLTEDCSVRVVFDKDEFWIEKLETKERIGHGCCFDTKYVVARLDVGAEIDWVLDSFAWLHHTSDRRLLHNLQEKAEDLPPPAVGDQLQILEHGSVGTERFKVPKVRYIADHAARNVISVAQLAYDHGLATVFEPTGCHVKDKHTGQIVGKGRLCDGAYVLDYLLILQDKVPRGQAGGGGQGGGDGNDGGQGGGGNSIGDRDGGQGGRGNEGQAKGGGGGDGGQGGGGINAGGRDGEKGGRGKEGRAEGGGGDEGGEEKEERKEGEGEGENEEEEEEEEEMEEKGGGGDEEEEEMKESSQTYANMYGLSRFKEDMDPKLPNGAFPTSVRTPRGNEFLVDSGACFHVTWDETVLLRYPPHLHDSTRPPIQSFGGVFGPTDDGVGSIKVTGSGYLNGDKIMLDGVLLAPDSQMNLVCVSQLVLQYWVSVEICLDVTIKKVNGNGIPIGKGYMNENHHYVLQYFKPQPPRLYAESPVHNHNFYLENFFGQPQE